MSVTLLITTGSEVGPSSANRFTVYTCVWHNNEIQNGKLKVYIGHSVCGPATKLTVKGHVSWDASSLYQIGATSSTSVVGGKTYYVSAWKYTSAYYSPGTKIDVSCNAYYTGSSGTIYKSTYSGTVTVPQIVNTYAVKYNANGGSGAPSSQTKTENVSLKLSSTVPVKSKYKFVSWSGSDGKTYQPGATFTGNYALTLTAVWKKESGAHIKIDGAYKDAIPYIKINGTYEEAESYIKINGIYKEGI